MLCMLRKNRKRSKAGTGHVAQHLDAWLDPMCGRRWTLARSRPTGFQTRPPAVPALLTGSMMNESDLAAYLDRIGATHSGDLDQADLRNLHRAHLFTVPFENLSIHLSERISLDEGDLIDKIVTRRRGGFCFELNGAFALLLEALGAEVARVAARVWGDDGLGPPFDHLALLVRLSDGSGPWLADVGFGDHSLYPLLFDQRTEQNDPSGRFRLEDAAFGDVDVIRDDRPQYRIEVRERSLAEFAPTCWWASTSSESHFTRKAICSRTTEGGRVTLSGSRLILTSDGHREERILPSEAAVLAAYREQFGMNLDRVPLVAGQPA